jgi:hypothetical protein
LEKTKGREGDGWKEDTKGKGKRGMKYKYWAS